MPVFLLFEMHSALFSVGFFDRYYSFDKHMIRSHILQIDIEFSRMINDLWALSLGRVHVLHCEMLGLFIYPLPIYYFIFYRKMHHNANEWGKKAPQTVNLFSKHMQIIVAYSLKVRTILTEW